MKTKINGFLTLLLAFVVQFTFAQEKTISGNVSDESGALPGVSVIIKGTSKGAQTDFDGNYTIKAKEGDVLQFSYIGMATKSINVTKDNTLNVILKASANVLQEVVVTALGIKREQKSLGYATQKVDGSAVNTGKTDNFVNGLSGRVAGLNIRRSAKLGGSVNVIIRGMTSLTGNNQALFVIDGVPINNANSNTDDGFDPSDPTKKNQNEGGKAYDYGNAAADIDPNNIASVNVLKGAAATALYGSRAANGVIMITTKKGAKNGKKFSISLNSSVVVGSIDKSTFPEYQDQYGAGYGPYYETADGSFFLRDGDGDGVNDNPTVPFTEDASYGAKFDPTRMVYYWDSFLPESPNYKKPRPWEAAKNGPITFFETPVAYTNNISIGGTTDKGNYRFSYTNLSQNGLMPNSNFKKNNLSFSGSFNVTDKLTVAGSAEYINNNNLGRNSTGYNDNIVTSFRQWWEVNTDVQTQKDMYFLTKRNASWNWSDNGSYDKPIFWDNFYYQRYENYETDSRDRFIGYASLNYKLTDWLDIYGRASVDTYSQLQEQRVSVGSLNPSQYTRMNRISTENNYDLMLKVNKNITDKLSLKGILGTNIRRNYSNSVLATTSGGLVVPGLYSLSNSTDPLPAPYEIAQKIGVDGVYGSLSFGYDDYLFLDITARNDKSSTLPEGNNSYFYPSVSTSFVFSKFLKADWLSFGKVRLNYAEVGNDAPFASLNDVYSKPNPFLGNTLFSVPSIRNNSDLKPEKTKSYEAGLQMKFLKNRIGFDFSYYKTNTINQIMPVSISPTSGYTQQYVNAGEIENKGIEVQLNGTPFKTESFNWNATVNFSQNRNKVLSLFGDVKNLPLGYFQGGVSLNATLGEPYGILKGKDFIYKNGQRVINQTTGRYEKTTKSDKNIGDVNPDFMASFSNTFTYKNLSLSFLLDMKKGGSLFSLDQWYGSATGIYKSSVGTNDLGNPIRNTLDEGGGVVLEGVAPDGTPNTVRTDMSNYANALGYARAPQKLHVYDASYIKLREVTITYSLPKKLIEKSPIQAVSFALTGSNLWIIHKNIPYSDPESGLSSGNIQGFQSGVMPTTRDFGFNVKVQF